MLTPHHQKHPLSSSHGKQEHSLTPQTHPGSQRESVSPGEGFLKGSYEHYWRFKKELMLAMSELDPLAILEAGIF